MKGIEGEEAQTCEMLIINEVRGLKMASSAWHEDGGAGFLEKVVWKVEPERWSGCLLYTSDAADEVCRV